LGIAIDSNLNAAGIREEIWFIMILGGAKVRPKAKEPKAPAILVPPDLA